MISMFIRKSSTNHAFLYQFYQNRLKNGTVWAFEYLQMDRNGSGHIVGVIEIKDKPVDNLH